MIKMLIVVVTVYTACYFPINIGWVSVVFTFHFIMFVSELLLGSLATLPPTTVCYVHTVFLWLALSHTCCNPVIYFWMNKKVRYKFAVLFSSVPFCNQHPLQVRTQSFLTPSRSLVYTPGVQRHASALSQVRFLLIRI